MRIGEPARKRGIADADIEHAVRHAIRELPIESELTILAGPARDGTLLEIGILGIDSDDPVVLHAMILRRGWYGHLGR
jgi:hypothetical protein